MPQSRDKVGCLVLVVTRSCNLKCVYCPVVKDSTVLDASFARREMGRWVARGVRLVRVTGGEPSLAWKTVEAVMEEVARLRSTGIDLALEICTNGTLWDSSMIRALRVPWARVVLSLDGGAETIRSIGRKPVDRLDEFLALPGFTVTQTIAPASAASVLDDFLHLWSLGIRRFNFLPAYYVEWDACERKALAEGLDAIADFLSPRIADGDAAVRNLERVGTVPLFGDDVTVDTDGRVYRTNLILAGDMARPLLPLLHSPDGEPPPLPRDFRRRLDAVLSPGVRRSTRLVDRVMDRMVSKLGRTGDTSRPHPAGSSRPGKRPERLEFHLSYRCSNRCEFCSEADRLGRWMSSPVSALEVRKVIARHAAAGGNHVNLTGGEPTDHPAFEYALALARSLGMRTYVGTNGARLADPGFAATVMPLLDELSLSIHGGTAHVHDACTGRKGSFDGLMATAENARRMAPGLSLYVNTVVTRRNVDSVADVVDLAKRLGVGHLLVSNAAPEGRALERYGALAVPLESWRTLAPDLASRADVRGLVMRFFGLPMCALGKAMMKSNDLYWDPRVTVERGSGARGSVRLQTVISRRPRRGRRQVSRCVGCRMRDVCGGVFVEYLERLGDEAIRPIRG